ncbi:Cysteine proteinase ACP1 [Entamoeba marina]
MFLILALALIASASEVEFRRWALTHQKSYSNRAEFLYRLAIFMDNKKFVEETPNTELNAFADMTHDEFVQTHLGMTREAEEPEIVEAKRSAKQVPESVDWRSIMNPAKDQASCGSCWTFCTTATLEGRVNKDLGTLFSLSEQELVDCDTTDNGCSGGHPKQSFTWIKKNGGLTTEDAYAYTGEEGTCKSFEGVATVSGYKRVTDGDEANLQELSATYGPIAIGMDASPVAFQLYQKGTVFSSSKCKRRIMNHCVTLVGYGTNDEGTPYWIVRNSWGTSWGDEGHFLLLRNSNNMCGVGMDSTYPTSVSIL